MGWHRQLGARGDGPVSRELNPGPRVGDGRQDGDVMVPESFTPPAIYGITSCEPCIGIKPVSIKVPECYSIIPAQELPDLGPDWGAAVRFSSTRLYSTPSHLSSTLRVPPPAFPFSLGSIPVQLLDLRL